MKKDPLPADTASGKVNASTPFFLGWDHPGTLPISDMAGVIIEMKNGAYTESAEKKRRGEMKEKGEKKNAATPELKIEGIEVEKKKPPRKSQRVAPGTSFSKLSMT